MGTGNASGLIRVGAILLTANTATTAYTTPTTGYGTIGANDSGISLVEARDFKNWTFTLVGGGTGYSFSIYGTADPLAYAQWRSAYNPQAYFGRVGGAPVLPASSWILLPGPSEQGGTGTVGNPLTAASPFFQYSGTLIGVRAVLVASASPSGVASVMCEATP